MPSERLPLGAKGSGPRVPLIAAAVLLYVWYAGRWRRIVRGVY